MPNNDPAEMEMETLEMIGSVCFYWTSSLAIICHILPSLINQSINDQSLNNAMNKKSEMKKKIKNPSFSNAVNKNPEMKKIK